MGRLEGQVAIVTGGGSGIGREAAKMLAAQGATVVVTGRRRAPLDEVVAEIRAAGGRAVARRVDMERGEEATRLGAWSIERLGRVDIVVHNAGHSSTVRSIRHVGPADWNSVVSVNLTGVYRLTQAVAEHMIRRGSGTFVTVSSMAAIRPGLLGGAPYGAAKAAARNLMGSVYAELRDKGIRATTIMPAEVDTPIMDKRPLPPDARARGTMMKAEDVAAAILLCVMLPPRTTIEEMVMSPTMPRDVTTDVSVARRMTYDRLARTARVRRGRAEVAPAARPAAAGAGRRGRRSRRRRGR